MKDVLLNFIVDIEYEWPCIKRHHHWELMPVGRGFCVLFALGLVVQAQRTGERASQRRPSLENAVLKVIPAIVEDERNFIGDTEGTEKEVARFVLSVLFAGTTSKELISTLY